MYGETVTVLSRTQTGTDRYGKPVYDWPEPGTQVPGCKVAPLVSEEPADIARNPVSIGFSVYMPPGVPVTPYDRVIVRGIVCEVIGEPGDWRSPYVPSLLAGKGVVVNVKRWEG